MNRDVAAPDTHTRTNRVVCVRQLWQDYRRVIYGSMQRVPGLMRVLAALIWLIGPGEGSSADIEAGRAKAQVCAACHGPDGHSTNPAFPSLAGQPPLYTSYQLLQFREQQRDDPQMSPVAANLSHADMQDIAAYYAAQTPVALSRSIDPEQSQAGRTLVQMHYCDSCHAPGLVGQKHIPRLAGQHYEYLLRQLRAFKAQTRPDMEGSMTMAAQPLSGDDIEFLARYIAQLPPMP
jgi:cytochrome c553